MPFAGYKDFAACVRANHDKDDPKGYCATIMRAVEKADQEYAAQMEIVEKEAKTKTVSGQTLHASDFAYVGDPEDPETWKLPVHDAAHARNALARFNQTEGIPSGEKEKVHNKVKAAAKKHGVEVADGAQKQFVIAKIDNEQQLVFGWASVAKDADGNLLEDLQGDIITMDELEPAVYDFVLESRVGTDLHPEDNEARGQLVESLVITPAKLESMGLVSKTAPLGAWWVGFKFDLETFAKVKAGDRTMFSIKGAAKRMEI